MSGSTISPLVGTNIPKQKATSFWKTFLGGLAGAAATSLQPFLAGISRQGAVLQQQSQATTEALVFSSPQSLTRNIGVPILLGVAAIGAVVIGVGAFLLGKKG